MLAMAMGMQAAVNLPSLITDGMVLQQMADVRLWGTATPGATVTVSASWGENATATVGSDGKWQTTIKTPQGSYEEQTLEFFEGDGHGAISRTIARLSDKITRNGDVEKVSHILIGEVWLASGQSNMEMPLKGFGGACVKDGYKDAMNAAQEAPYIRMFNVERKQTFTPQENCNGQWMYPTFDNALLYSATAYYFAASLSNALKVPVGIVNASYGGTRVESWSSAQTCWEYPDVPKDSISVFNCTKWDFERPIVTYNAMFHPISRYSYRGIIWYQGCGNVGNYSTYSVRLANMVRQWRSELALGDIPFYQVEIAPYIYGASENATGGAMLREQQYQAQYMIPNCDIVCTNDLVEPMERYNIHPREKRTVGLRLAMLALNKTYGRKDLPCSGPRFDRSKFRIEGNKAVVGFVTNQFGICRNYGLEGFEIAGADRVFHPAQAEFKWQTNEVFLTSSEVPQPVAVRYCFKDFQIGNLIGGAEMPLFPFRTDDWEK